MAENSILDYAWYVSTRHDDKDDEVPPLIAAALCVHEDGFLMSVILGIRLFEEAEPLVKVRPYNGSELEAEIMTTTAGKAFGIATLKIIKTEGNEDQKFKYVQFPDDMNVSVDSGTKIYACVHDMGCHFNIENGLVCSTFPGNLTVPPNIFGSFTFPSSTSLAIRTIGSVATMENVGHECGYISNDDEIRNMVGDSVFQTCALLNRSVPLIEVSGLGLMMFDGQCGGPVFTKKGNKLLGLVFLSTGYKQFVIPARVLKEVYDGYGI